MYFLKLIITIILLISFIGCSVEEETTNTDTSSVEEEIINTDTNTTLLSESLRGEWVYVKSGETIYVDESFDENITQIDENLISIENNSNTDYMIRKGINTTAVNMTFYEETNPTAAPTIRSTGTISISLEHESDEANKHIVELNSVGDINFTNVISGHYVLKAITDTNLSVERNVDIYGEDVALGNFKLVSNNNYNFKTDIIIENRDNGYLYGTMKTYTGKFIVKNIGSKKASGISYKFSTDDGRVADFSSEIVLSTIEIGESIEIPFSITFNILDETIHTVPIEVQIKDIEGKEWIDTLSLDVYQMPININIITQESNIKGYIIVPGHDVIDIDTNNATIMIPYREGVKYYLVLANPNIDNETLYSVGVDVPTLNYDSFQDTAAHEPNNDESYAKILHVGESTISYLHEDDIDYFIIDMSSDVDVGIFSPPQIPFT